MATLKIGVTGLGKTGSLVAARIIADKTTSLVLASVSTASRKAGHDVGKFLKRNYYGVKITGSDVLEKAMERSSPSVIIDFTNPLACLENLEIAARKGVNAVVGTTGFTKKQLARIRGFGRKIALVMAPNISEGVNILAALSRMTARLWPGCDINIIEMHHREKKDSPSGTARLIAEGIGEDDKKKSRPFKNKAAERRIQVHSIRAGGAMSSHEVRFVDETQMLKLTHSLITREAFVAGAVNAAKWLAKKRNGVYYMDDVLGFKALNPGQ